MHIRTLTPCWELQLAPEAHMRKPLPLLLVTYLAVQGPQERKQLTTLFWPDASAQAQRRSLSDTLRVLRPPQTHAYLVDTDPKKHLLHTPCSCDLLDFKRSVQQRNVPKVLELYQGDFFACIEKYRKLLLVKRPALYMWIQDQREQAAYAMTQLLLGAAKQEAAEQRMEFALRYAQHMYTHLHHKALLTYQDYQALLALYLASDVPKSQLYALKRDAYHCYPSRPLRLSHHPKQYFTPLHNLPPAPVVIGQREAQLHIKHSLQQPDTHVVTLTGSVGIGKTTLALAVAWQCLYEYMFTDGVYLIDLSQARSIADVEKYLIDNLKHIINVPIPARASWAWILKQLALKHCLIILDHYPNQLSQRPTLHQRIHDLLQHCPDLRMIITAHTTLGLMLEQHYPVPALTFPRKQDIAYATAPTPQALTQYSACQLFWHHTPYSIRVRASENDLYCFINIMQRLCGHPLALCMAAQLSKQHSYAEIARFLQHNVAALAFPTQNTKPVPVRHQSLQQAFEDAWNQLSPVQQTLYAQLSVFHGRFTLDLYQRVINAPLLLLRHLIERSLVYQQGKDAYILPPPMQVFARQKLTLQPRVERCTLQRYRRALPSYLTK